MKKSVVIIGSGFGGLGTACLLTKAGYSVTVLEKNEQLGGRAGVHREAGFTFDTGPSWYLMPGIFEHFFSLMEEKVTDHLKLTKLSPSYRIFYKDLGEQLDITGDLVTDMQTFEQIEPGAGAQLKRYLACSESTYRTATGQFLYKNYDSVTDLLSPSFIRDALRIHAFSSMDRYVQRYFQDPRLQKIMQYPLVFLGASPYNAPAVYSLMSHVDMTQGVFYPMGGMYEVTKALVAIGKKHGVQYRTNTPVDHIIVNDKKVTGVQAAGKKIAAGIVVSNADVAYTEQHLLPAHARHYSNRYWERRVMAPSALLLYLGVNRTYPGLPHHNLLFSKDWQHNFSQIFGSYAGFPDDPSLYVCAPSRTDPSVAPAGHENMFVLVPIAPGITYTDAQLAAFTDITLQTLENHMQLTDLRKHLVYQKAFCVRDFAERFNSYKGTGLGLAHTLLQTAPLRPHNYSKKIRGLYYAGANVHPGIGLPSALISAELVLKRLAGDRSAHPLRCVEVQTIQ